MTPAPRPNPEETIFAQALALPTADRAAYLRQACADDSGLRARIEALLRADVSSDFMAAPAVELAGNTTRPPGPGEEKTGESIGRYKLLQKIGEGGCGTVYMAEQTQPVVRRVALKVIKLGMDTREVIARFEAERQALALMDHPNIARVLDAGATDAGRPYFVMELVRGIPITKFCDEQNLATTTRLELFTDVCHAVQHAHQKGIIHRDLKPSNILVALHDGRPVPKVIDFGIAKATGGRLTDNTLFTAFNQFIGTPAYMSPEQAEMSGLDIDTRSDIYSLGVLLYELLTGRPPFDPKSLVSAGLDEIRRIIREVDPPRPSTRLSTLTDADRATIARQRGLAPAQLSTLLRGDLDWIVMRCLEKDRGRRYDTPSALATDISRHLSDLPVSARPPSAWYVVQKLVRRHRVGFVSGSVVALALIAALAVSLQLLQRERTALARTRVAEQKTHAALETAQQQKGVAEQQRALAEQRLRAEEAARAESERQRSLAEQERNKAQAAERAATTSAAIAKAVGDFLTNDLLSQASPEQQPDRDIKLRTLLDRAAKRLDGRFPEQPEVELALRVTLGTTYRQLSEYESARKNYQAALELARKSFGPENPRVLGLMHSVSIALRYLDRLPEAEALARETLALQQRVLGPEHGNTLGSMSDLAVILRRLNKLEEADRVGTAALEGMRRTLGPDHAHTLATLTAVANTRNALGRRDEAHAMFVELRDAYTRVLGAEHPHTLGASYSVAISLFERGHIDDSIRLHRENLALQTRVLGPEHSDTLDTMSSLGAALSRQGNHAEAEPLLTQTVALCTRLYGPDHAATLTARHHLAGCYSGQNKLAEAEALHAELLDVRKRKYGPTHRSTVNSMNDLAVVYQRQRKLDDAAALFAQTTEINRRTLPPGHPATILSTNNLAIVHMAAGRFDEAIHALSELVETCKKSYGPDHTRTLVAQNNLAAIGYRQAGRYPEAETLHRATLEQQLRTQPLADIEIQRSVNNLATALRDQGKLADAIQLYSDMAARYERGLGPNHDATLMCLSNLGWNSFLLGRYDDALRHTQESLRRRTAKGETDSNDVFSTLATIADARQATGRHDEAIAMHEDIVKRVTAKFGPNTPAVFSRTTQLAVAYRDAGRLAEAEALLEEKREPARVRLGETSEQWGDLLAALGRVRLLRHRYVEAEEPLRLALKISELQSTTDWSRFSRQAQLGAALAAQNRFTEAEPLLIGGVSELLNREASIPVPLRHYVREAVEAIAHAYEANRQPAKAAPWRERLAALGEPLTAAPSSRP